MRHPWNVIRCVQAMMVCRSEGGWEAGRLSTRPKHDPQQILSLAQQYRALLSFTRALYRNVSVFSLFFFRMAASHCGRFGQRAPEERAPSIPTNSVHLVREWAGSWPLVSGTSLAIRLAQRIFHSILPESFFPLFFLCTTFFDIVVLIINSASLANIYSFSCIFPSFAGAGAGCMFVCSSHFYFHQSHVSFFFFLFFCYFVASFYYEMCIIIFVYLYRNISFIISYVTLR